MLSVYNGSTSAYLDLVHSGLLRNYPIPILSGFES